MPHQAQLRPASGIVRDLYRRSRLTGPGGEGSNESQSASTTTIAHILPKPEASPLTGISLGIAVGILEKVEEVCCRCPHNPRDRDSWVKPITDFIAGELASRYRCSMGTRHD